jgi:hypothetical protein
VNPFVNSRLAWKKAIAALILSVLFSFPMIETFGEQKLCLDSIS